MRLWTWLLGLWQSIRKKRPAEPSARIPDTTDTRFAVHEAGHLICAWYYWHTSDIHRVSIGEEEKNGSRTGRMTFYTEAEGDDPEKIAGRMVISLGGIAAETLLFGNFRSGTVERDLLNARDMANKLSAWPLDEVEMESKIDFGKMFSGGLSGEEEARFMQAYRFARRMLASRFVEHAKVTSALLTHRTLTQEVLEKLLGSRAQMRVLRFLVKRVFS